MATPTTWGNWSTVWPTGNTLIDALVWGTRWTNPSISYSFPATASYWSTSAYSGYDVPGSANEPWSASMKGLYTEDRAAVRTALAAWANVASITFTEVSESATLVGDLRFAYTSGEYCGNPDSQAWAYFPGSTACGGDVWFNTQYSSFTAPWDPGSYEYQTVLHEIGHALGLKHPFEGEPNGKTLPVQSDTRSQTVMSYRAGVGLDDSYFSYEPTTPMVLDILAVQAIYGANTTHNTGDTTYSFGTGLYHEAIWDAGGTDAIVDLSSLGSTINLNEGAGSRLGASVFVQNSAGANLFEIDNLWIAFGTTIENATGGGGDDLLIGNAIGNVLVGGGGADTFRGGAGADTLDGGAGDDIAAYDGSRDNYTVTFNAVTSIFTVASALEGTDSVKDVESFEFGGIAYSAAAFIDLTAPAVPGQVVNGGLGPDSLAGSAGDDTVNGGGGIDSFALTGSRCQYSLTQTAGGYQTRDSAGRDGCDSLAAVETLLFADCTVDLTMRQKAAAMSTANLKTLQELYVGFFNRIPEAAGLSYWMDQIQSGVTLKAVADQFYSAGLQFGVYSDAMTEAQFITAIYANVLGRTGANAPNTHETGYWQQWLHTGSNSKGAMVLQMLGDSHNFFAGDPAVGWVVDLLDNKAKVASYFAIELGMTYNSPQINISKGIEVAAAITPDDITAAIELIGIAS